MTDDRRQLKTLENILEFMHAGNSTMTLVSRKTGTRFTYKIKKSDDGRLFFVSVLTGQDNESDYRYLGTMRDGTYNHGRKSAIGIDAPSNVAFTWFYRQLDNLILPTELEVWHEGTCGRCGRKLTVPESIARGIGPECAKHFHT